MKIISERKYIMQQYYKTCYYVMTMMHVQVSVIKHVLAHNVNFHLSRIYFSPDTCTFYAIHWLT